MLGGGCSLIGLGDPAREFSVARAFHASGCTRFCFEALNEVAQKAPLTRRKRFPHPPDRSPQLEDEMMETVADRKSYAANGYRQTGRRWIMRRPVFFTGTRRPDHSESHGRGALISCKIHWSASGSVKRIVREPPRGRAVSR